MYEKYITTVKITKKELNRLLDLATYRKRKVEIKKNGNVENIYIDGELFAERMPHWCILVIYL